ncbi:MAG: site-specific tyrosine recombinase XerD [Saprospiraceae bacterium]|nr:site-specific tyrosine recombinase XerD [Saprospiraceae bacterium]
MSIWKIHIKSFEDYLMLEKGLSENSVIAYSRDVWKLAEYLAIIELDLSPQTIQREAIQQFLAYLNDLGFAATSQARLISGLKAFFNFLLVEKVIEIVPTDLIESPNMGRKLPSVLSFEEIEQLLAAIDLSKPEGHRNRAIVETLYACGLRVSELTDLKISNLYLDIGFVKVLGKGNKERFVPIGEDAIKYINFYKTDRKHLKTIHDDDVLFLNRRGKPLSRVMIFYIIKDLAKAVGLQKNISPHTFRHSFATHLIEGGADLRAIQDMLGHASITTTEIYTHLDNAYLRDTLLAHHPLYKNKNT